MGWRGGSGPRRPPTGLEQPPRQKREAGRPGASKTVPSESSWACLSGSQHHSYYFTLENATALCLLSYSFLSMRATGTYPHAIWAAVLSKNSSVTKAKNKLLELLAPVSDILLYGNKLVYCHLIIMIKNIEITWFLQCAWLHPGQFLCIFAKQPPFWPMASLVLNKNWKKLHSLHTKLRK